MARDRVPDKTVDAEAIRFYYDLDKLSNQLRKEFDFDARAMKAGLIILPIVLAALVVFLFESSGRLFTVWEALFTSIILSPIIILPIILFISTLKKRKGALDQIINKLGPDSKSFLEINREGLMVPAGLVSLEDLMDDRTLVDKLLAVPLVDIKWAYIGIGPGMEKNLVIKSDRMISVFDTKTLEIDPSHFKEPVEKIADCLLFRGITVKVVWIEDGPYGYEFKGFQPVGKNSYMVKAVRDHVADKVYDQRDWESIDEKV